MKRRTILEIIYISFLILWGYAAFSKIFAYEVFNAQLSKSPLLGSMASVVAIGIPVIELVLSAMLILEKTKRIALILSLVLMVTFTVYLIYILTFSTEVPCSCGGLLQKLTWLQHIYFNLGFIGLAIIGTILQSHRFANWNSGGLNRGLIQRKL